MEKNPGESGASLFGQAEKEDLERELGREFRPGINIHLNDPIRSEQLQACQFTPGIDMRLNICIERPLEIGSHFLVL